MPKEILLAEVLLWGTVIGYVSWDVPSQYAAFEYSPEFLKSSVDVAPLKMPRKPGVYIFKELDRSTYKGLPGMLADSLPDKFGNALIDVWLSNQHRDRESFNPVERLCYMGSRGMGALEFRPSINQGSKKTVNINIESMVGLASEILSHREQVREKIATRESRQLERALTNLLIVGTSAGGARAKCIIAYNEATGDVVSGQIKTTPEYGYWILKLDGVEGNRDRELTDPMGFGRLEYAYYLMATACGIDIMESRLLMENERAHFMTRRFDRLPGGEKLHLQSLCALNHFDFNMPGAYSYEQVMEVIRQIVTEAPQLALEQQFRRAVFNVVGRNQDDHTKNIAFLMNKRGEWSLSPAYDVTYSYNPTGAWTSQHQLTLNGKRDGFELEDLLALALKADIRRARALKIVKEITAVFSAWPTYAERSGVFEPHRQNIQKNFRILA